MEKKENKMHLPTIDDLFTTQEERDSANLEKVIPNAEEEAKVEEALGMRPETGPVVTPVVETPKPAETKPAEDTPTRNFGGFSF